MFTEYPLHGIVRIETIIDEETQHALITALDGSQRTASAIDLRLAIKELTEMADMIEASMPTSKEMAYEMARDEMEGEEW